MMQKIPKRQQADSKEVVEIHRIQVLPHRCDQLVLRHLEKSGQLLHNVFALFIDQIRGDMQHAQNRLDFLWKFPQMRVRHHQARLIHKPTDIPFHLRNFGADAGKEHLSAEFTGICRPWLPRRNRVNVAIHKRFHLFIRQQIHKFDFAEINADVARHVADGDVHGGVLRDGDALAFQLFRMKNVAVRMNDKLLRSGNIGQRRDDLHRKAPIIQENRADWRLNKRKRRLVSLQNLARHHRAGFDVPE